MSKPNEFLKDPGLLRQASFVAGEWVSGSDSGEITVENPADGTVLGSVPNLAEKETRTAIDAARRAFPEWRAKPAKERAAILTRWSRAILDNIDDLAHLMTAEQGKPLAEARGEVTGAAGFVQWFAEEAKRAYGEVIPSPAPDRRLIVIKQPIGVAGAISPWNFPSSMIARKCAPALAAGCTVVAKPAPETPFSALALVALAERAGLPPGVLNMVTGDAEAIGRELTSHEAVRKFSFTGSTAVGKLLMAQCATTVKKVSLELGGLAPFIIFEDADLESAARELVSSKFRNSGQTCVCANRVYVQSSVHDAFLEHLLPRVRALKVGAGVDEGVNIGPLINRRAVEKVESHVANAVAGGAEIASGGNRHALGRTFFEPTVLTEVQNGMLVTCEETFGPVLPIVKFETEDEVIARANDTPYGLSSYLFTRDLARTWRLAEGLEAGIVGINVGVTATEVAPFGGVKESGLGREGSHYGIDEYLDVKYICLGGLSS